MGCSIVPRAFEPNGNAAVRAMLEAVGRSEEGRDQMSQEVLAQSLSRLEFTCCYVNRGMHVETIRGACGAGSWAAGVWELYQATIQHLGSVPTLIEWDNDIPEFAILVDEANKAQRVLDNFGVAA